MNIQIELDKIGGILTTNKKGEKIIILPYKESWIDTFVRKDGTNGIKLNFSTAKLKEPRISDNGLFQDIAIVKQNIKKEVFEKLTDEQKQKIAICGQVTEYIGTAKPAEPVELTDEEQPVEEETVKEIPADDLPF
jgi:hypothetical protein